MTKVPANSVPSEDSLAGGQPLSHCVLTCSFLGVCSWAWRRRKESGEGEGARALTDVSSYKGTNPIGSGFHISDLV